MAGRGMNGTNTSSGSFGIGPNAPNLCTATSKRSRQQCEGPAIAGTDPPRCRMHGGASLRGTSNPSFKTGEYSKFLPAKLDELYQDAISNPDLLEMSRHIALLEARVKDILSRSSEGDPVPEWKEVAEAFAQVETAILSGEPDTYIRALDRMHGYLDAGQKWDATWHQVLSTMEQLRKMVDTEVKRKKELHQMIPVERVMILVAALSNIVKRNVTNPAEVQAIQREFASLYANHSSRIAGPEVIDVAPNMRGVGGGGSKPAIARRIKQGRDREMGRGATLVGDVG